MSSAAVIINARHQLPWHRRLVSDGATAALWGWWIWLCKPALGVLTWLVGSANASVVPKLALLNGGAMLQTPVVALLSTSSTLMLWNLLPTIEAPRSVPRTLRDDAQHFDLPETELSAGRAASVCVVHHGSDGRILRIETA